MASQEFTVALNIWRAPSRNAHLRSAAKEEFTVAQNIRLALSSRAINWYCYFIVLDKYINCFTKNDLLWVLIKLLTITLIVKNFNIAPFWQIVP